MSMFLGNLLSFLGTWKGKNSTLGKALSAVGNVLNPLSSIMNAGGSLVNSVTGAGLTGAEVAQNQWNAEQAQIARDWDEEMYLKYNSPQALMSQYREAGLNPALMYGQNVAGNAPMSSPVAEGVSPSGGLDLGELVSLMGLKSEIDVNKARAENINQATKESQSRVTRIETEIKSIGQNIVESKAKVRNLDIDTDNKRIISNYLDEQYQSQIRLTNMTADERFQSIEESKARIEALDVQNRERLSNIAVNSARIQELLSQSDLNAAQRGEVVELTKKVSQETELVKKNTSLTQLDIDYYNWNHAHKLNASGGLGVSVGAKGVSAKGNASIDYYDFAGDSRSDYK